jgi:hypothetical protein
MVDPSLCHADLSLQEQGLILLDPLDQDTEAHLVLALHTDRRLDKDVEGRRKSLLPFTIIISEMSKDLGRVRLTVEQFNFFNFF